MRNVMNRESNVEEFLESANEALLESKRLHRRTEMLSARCAALVRINGVGQENRELEELWKVLEKERLRELEVTRFEMARYREVEEFIDKMDDAVYRMILRRRYLDVGLTWVQIQQRLHAEGFCYSERHIRRLVKQAVAEAQRLWEEKT